MASISRRELLRLAAVAPFGLPQPHEHACPAAAYRPWPFSARGITHDVYTAGTGPHVIVLHEITGPSSLFFRFTDCLVAHGFQVHCPALFGKAFSNPKFFLGLRACVIGPEIDCWRPSGFSRLNPWLVALAAQISGEKGEPVGAIGMCLTGIQPLAMLRCRAVVAPVLCQPTVPFGPAWKDDLGLNPSDIDFAAARVRTEQMKVLAIRYSGDGKCPPERMARLERLLGPHIDIVTLDGSHHSSLVHDPSKEAFDRVVTFLDPLKK